MVKTIYVSKIMTDDEIQSKEGEHFDEKHYELILDEDADVFTDEGKLLLKLRKNVLSKKIQTWHYLHLEMPPKKLMKTDVLLLENWIEIK